jgi:hypothetical protein
MTFLRSVFVSLLGSAVVIFNAASATQFGLQQRKLPKNRTVIRVYDRENGRTIWRRITRNVIVVRWANDGTALAIVEALDSVSPWLRLIAWRSGEPVRSFRHIAPFRRFETVKDVVWSPDHTQLLLIGPRSMGEADLGFGSLWCFRLQDAKARMITDAQVTRAQWLTAKRVRFWTGKYVKGPKAENTSTLAETPHEATCP